MPLTDFLTYRFQALRAHAPVMNAKCIHWNDRVLSKLGQTTVSHITVSCKSGTFIPVTN